MPVANHCAYHRTISRKAWSAVFLLVVTSSFCGAGMGVINDTPRPAEAAAAPKSGIGLVDVGSGPVRIADLDFPGGTVKQYAESISAAISPISMNVIYKGQADALKVSPVRLRGVTPRSALELLASSLTQSKLTLQYLGGAEKEEQGIYVITNHDAGEEAAALRMLLTRVYSLREWTVAESPDAAPLADSRRAAALGAIEQGLSFGLETNPGPSFKPIVRYHPESGLLFVRASGQDQDIAESIVRKLEQSFRDADNAKKDQDEEQKRTLKMLSLQREVDALRAKLDPAKKPPLLSGVVRVREDVRAKVLEVVREVTKQDGSIDGKLEIFEAPHGIQLKGPADLVHYAVSAARGAARVLGDDDAEFQEQSLPR